MRRRLFSSAVALAAMTGALFFHSFEVLAYAPPVLGSSGDYLEAVSQQGTHRWAAERLPLKVFIEDGSLAAGYRSSHRELLRKAFDEWCRISNGKLSWLEVPSASQADIVCGYSDTPRKSGPSGFEAGVTHTMIQQNRYTNQSSIIKAQMTILTQWRGKAFTDREIYMTSLHEVGHALGMQGHSDVPSDIMYHTVNAEQVPILSARDAATVARLYTTYGSQPTVVYNSRQAPPAANSRRQASFGQPPLAPSFASPENPDPGGNQILDRGNDFQAGGFGQNNFNQYNRPGRGYHRYRRARYMDPAQRARIQQAMEEMNMQNSAPQVMFVDGSCRQGCSQQGYFLPLTQY